MPREILVNWTGPSGSSVTVTNWSDAVPVEGQRALLGTFLSDLSANLSAQYSWTVAIEGAEFAAATGTNTGYWADGTPFTGVGESSGQPVADATQVLLRWRTSGVVAGRRVLGRTFIPGYLALGLTAGNINPGALAVLQATVDAFVLEDLGFSVYSRPTDARPGSMHVVDSGSVWNELAVLRRRRG